MMRSQVFLIRTVPVAMACLLRLASPASARTWSDDSGKFSIEADLVSTENGEVTLKRADGKLVHLPIDKLSKADQDFLAKKSPPASPNAPTGVAPSTREATDSGSHATASADAPAVKRVNLKQDAKAIAAAEQAVAELYKDEMAGARTLEKRVALARKIIQISKTEADPNAKYVLARKGSELAAGVGYSHLTLVGLNELQAACDDSLSVTTDCLEILLAHSPDDPGPPNEKINALLSVAIASDNFAVAAKLATMASSIARLSKDPAQMAATKLRVAEVGIAKDESRKFAAAQVQLKQNPQDADSKAVVGRYLCLVRRDWEQGLPLLNGSNDKTLQPLAAAELKAGKTPAEIAALGDSWLAASKKLPLHLAAQERGLFWYRQALPGANGLTKARIAKELAAHEMRLGIDLIARLDLKRDVALGPWTSDGRSLMINSLLSEVEFSKITLATPADVTRYQLQLEVTQRPSLSDGVVICLPVGNRAIGLMLGGLDRIDHLVEIDGPDFRGDQMATFSTPNCLGTDQRTSLVIDVNVKDNEGQIQVVANKRKIIWWKGPISQLKTLGSWATPHPERIGLAVSSGVFMFHSARLLCGNSAPPLEGENR